MKSTDLTPEGGTWLTMPCDSCGISVSRYVGHEKDYERLCKNIYFCLPCREAYREKKIYMMGLPPENAVRR